MDLECGQSILVFWNITCAECQYWNSTNPELEQYTSRMEHYSFHTGALHYRTGALHFRTGALHFRTGALQSHYDFYASYTMTQCVLFKREIARGLVTHLIQTDFTGLAIVILNFTGLTKVH